MTCGLVLPQCFDADGQQVRRHPGLTELFGLSADGLVLLATQESDQKPLFQRARRD
jgi:hypothetical protein